MTVQICTQFWFQGEAGWLEEDGTVVWGGGSFPVEFASADILYAIARG